LAAKIYAIIDIETTGGKADSDKITEIAIMLHDGTKILDTFETLINPERSIPYFITQVTGITDDMVADAPKFYEVAKQIVKMTEGAIFVAHNVRFDYGFVQEEFRRVHIYTQATLHRAVESDCFPRFAFLCFGQSHYTFQHKSN
jgi:DNA polymerase III subunit epsilon